MEYPLPLNQTTGRTMTVSYEEARKRVAVIADAFEADATFGSDLLKALDYGKAADSLRSILAGPPEPNAN